jgi:hypothetical protein
MISYEEVEVYACSEKEAIQLILDDHDEVKVIEDRYSDWELDKNLIEVKE